MVARCAAGRSLRLAQTHPAAAAMEGAAWPLDDKITRAFVRPRWLAHCLSGREFDLDAPRSGAGILVAGEHAVPVPPGDESRSRQETRGSQRLRDLVARRRK